MKVVIHCDGSSDGGTGGVGGWGAVLIFGSTKKEISGSFQNASNNRAEIEAAIQALSVLKRPCEVELHSDSAYLVSAMKKGWVKRWAGNGWRTAQDRGVENVSYWQRLEEATRPHSVSWIKVSGHSGIEGNERAHDLALSARKQGEGKEESGVGGAQVFNLRGAQSAASEAKVARNMAEEWAADYGPESKDLVRRFGRIEARLYPYVGYTVQTPDGPGELLQVGAGACQVLLDSEPVAEYGIGKTVSRFRRMRSYPMDTINPPHIKSNAGGEVRAFTPRESAVEEAV